MVALNQQPIASDRARSTVATTKNSKKLNQTFTGVFPNSTATMAAELQMNESSNMSAINILSSQIGIDST